MVFRQTNPFAAYFIAYAASREKKKTSTEDVAGADQEATSAIDIDAKIDEEEEADEEEQEQDTEEALDDQIENLEIDPAMTAYKRAHLEDMLAINADEDELTSEHTDDRET